MFIKLSLKELYDNKKYNLELFSNRQKRDMELILKQIEKEELSVLSWSIYEIALLRGTKNTFVYCLQSSDNREVDVYVLDNGKIEPHYFKFFDENNYRAEKAENLREAIEQNRRNKYKYENFQIQKLQCVKK